MKKVGARPHLGRFCQSFTDADMARQHGESYSTFKAVADAHDPDRKYSNDFTRRRLGH